MKECMETGEQGNDLHGTGEPKADKPLISIVMATYNPRMDWLKEQLTSLENQTYRPLELIILDDCSTRVSLDEIRACAESCIRSIPYQIFQNKENIGSTKTFEKLTLLANGEYIAYCDQDDVWHEDKIETCLEALMKSAGVLAFSDMVIIDGDGEKLADSITKVRKHHKFYSGSGLARVLLFSNFVTGCATLIKTEKARAAIPFCPYMVHDHWLALYCSINGELVFIEKPLLDYRIHDNNQTLMMAGVFNKASYFNIRIEKALEKFVWLQEHIGGSNDLRDTISQAIEWMQARKEHFNTAFKGAATIWKYRKFSYLTSIFELAAPFMSERLFMFIIGLKKRNII